VVLTVFGLVRTRIKLTLTQAMSGITPSTSYPAASRVIDLEQARHSFTKADVIFAYLHWPSDFKMCDGYRIRQTHQTQSLCKRQAC
jgi:hypothetical protein